MFESVLPQSAKDALAVLGKSKIVRDGYLAGGTALALHFGHRQSIDFDFFSEKTFDSAQMNYALQASGTFDVDTVEKNTLLGTFQSVKFSYFYYPYPMLQPTVFYDGVALAHIQDIAAMKLVAITDRSTKKDFIDLYALIHHGISIEEMFSLYEKKYHVLEANMFTLIKSLTFFIDADNDEMPQMLTTIVWEDVKQFFAAEAVRLGKKYLEGKENVE